MDLQTLRRSIVAYAARFDARLLSCAQAGEVMLACAQIEACLASIKALAAARAAEGDSWKSEGYRSPADELAQRTKISPSLAKRTLETGRRLGEQPEVAKAALSGELSFEQAAIVTEGVQANPDKASQLITHAQRASLSELSEEVARIKAASIDPEARRQAIHQRRFFRRWSDRDGALQAHLYGQVEDGARVWGVLDPIRRRLGALREKDGRRAERDPFEALDYDALVAMAEIASGKEGELSLADLLELGLFPQLEPDMLAGREVDLPATGESERSASDRGQPGGIAPRPALSAEAADALRSDAGLAQPPQGDTSDPESLSLLADCLGVDPGASEKGKAAGSAPRSTVPGPAGEVGAPAAQAPAVPGAAAESSAAPATSSSRRKRKLAGSPLQVMVRVDLDTLLRGVAIEGELCEVAGYGPVPVSVIEKLAANDNAFVVGVLTKSTQVLGVYHYRRHPNASQTSALQFLYPSCAAAGCSARAGLQYDHRADWARTKVTVFDLLDRLCPHHHRLKTNHGWQLVEGSGKRAFVPPGDPRHPARLAGAATSPDPP